MKLKYLKKRNLNSGQAMMITVMFFLAGSLIVLGGISSPILKDLKISRNIEKSKQSIYLSESGLEDVVYRIKNSMNFSDIEVLSVNGITATSTTAILADKREVVSVSNKNNVIRTTKALLAQGDGVAFNYGVQVGDGGLRMNNSSSVAGNIYSNGPVIGANSNTVTGNIISGGPNGLIDGVHTTGSGYAHTIINSSIDTDAHYQSISNTNVGGTLYPGSADQATSSMSIPDSMIAGWEAVAEAGGVISSPCPYKINSNKTIGPVKIACDLEITGSPVVTLGGHIWVTGDISIENSADIRIASSVGSRSIAIIADNPVNRLTSSKIKIKNSAEFFGSGSAGSYILIVSQNNSAENGGNEEAIEVENSADVDLLIYAPHGDILLKNSVGLKEVTGYKITINNTAQVIYDTGFANLLFTSGPSGGFFIDSWLEI